MREYLFCGKRTDNGEWVYGSPIFEDSYVLIRFWNSEEFEYEEYLVAPESVGQYTGMNEFVLTDASRNAKLFEGDIVEVWGWRSVYGRNQSQYDKRVKVRGVIRFKGRGQWCIDYDNKYNEALAKLKGSETDKRQAEGAYELYYYGYHGSDIEKYRAKELEWHGRFHNKEDIYGHNDIIKIGTVFENADLLEG
jgi:hypothetical protein